jgi:hypothetical protein
MTVSVVHAALPPGHTAREDTSFIRHLYDPDARVAQSGVSEPVVMIADQWREIHDRIPIGARHEFPPIGEIASWGRYLATRCPECEGEAL